MSRFCSHGWMNMLPDPRVEFLGELWRVSSPPQDAILPH